MRRMIRKRLGRRFLMGRWKRVGGFVETRRARLLYQPVKPNDTQRASMPLRVWYVLVLDACALCVMVLVSAAESQVGR
jgi:hypothetical protein